MQRQWVVRFTCAHLSHWWNYSSCHGSSVYFCCSMNFAFLLIKIDPVSPAAGMGTDGNSSMLEGRLVLVGYYSKATLVGAVPYQTYTIWCRVISLINSKTVRSFFPLTSWNIKVTKVHTGSYPDVTVCTLCSLCSIHWYKIINSFYKL